MLCDQIKIYHCLSQSSVKKYAALSLCLQCYPKQLQLNFITLPR